MLVATGIRVCGTPGGDVHLPWERYGPSAGDWWYLDDWFFGRGGPVGVAIRAGGRDARALTRLREQRRTVWNLIDRRGDRATLTPLYAARTINLRVDADRVALVVLCQALARRSEWRPQLADPARVAQLLRDLASTDHAEVAQKAGVRRRGVETLLAMKQLKLEHPLSGRPLPDEPRPDSEQVVQAVLEKVRANPYALAADEPYVRKFVHRYYLDIAAWPFAALEPPLDERSLSD